MQDKGKRKLVKLICAFSMNRSRESRSIEDLADYLIANGVVVVPENSIILSKNEITALSKYQETINRLKGD